MASEQNKSIATAVGLVLVASIIVAVAVFFYLRPPAAEDTKAEVFAPNPAAESPSAATPEEARPVYQAPEPEPQEQPLPVLAESDRPLLDAVEKLSEAGLKLLVPEEVIRKFVRAVNAADEGKLVHEYRPLVSPAPPFKVDLFDAATGETEQYKLSVENYQRYDKYVSAFTAIDTDALVSLYKRYYPLLEEAYTEMGLKKGNFHTVMLGAIDNAIAAPVIESDVLLTRPKVFYQFADPKLEALPATQKLMLRMGPENARSLKASLKALRAKLAE